MQIRLRDRRMITSTTVIVPMLGLQDYNTVVNLVLFGECVPGREQIDLAQDLRQWRAKGGEPKELKVNKRYTAQQLRIFGLKPVDIIEKEEDGSIVREGYTVKELLDAEFDGKDMLEAGVEAKALKEAMRELDVEQQLAYLRKGGYHVHVSGLKWYRSKVNSLSDGPPRSPFKGAETANDKVAKPLKGTELDHARLAEDLPNKVPNSFTKAEWARYDITDLGSHHYVKSGDRYFQPAVHALHDAGFSAKQLGLKGAELRQGGFTATELKSEDFKATDLRDGGFFARELLVADFGKSDIKSGGYTVQELKEEEPPFDAKECHDAGYTPKELKEAGFDMSELKDGGYTATELLSNKFDEEELKAAGFTAQDLLEGGSTLSKLREAGYTAEGLRNEGFSPDRLCGDDLFSMKEIKAGGFDAKELFEKSFKPQQLREGGYLPSEFLAGGFQKSFLRTAGYTGDPAATHTRLLRALMNLTICSFAGSRRA